MTKNTPFLLLAILALLSACKKDKDSANPYNIIKTEENLGQGIAVGENTYDSQNRLTNFTVKYNGGIIYKHEYIYSASSLVRNEYYQQGNTPTSTTTYTLNSAGRVVAQSGNATYIYDADGHLIHFDNNAGHTEDYIYENGDKVMAIFDGDTTTYTYSATEDIANDGLQAFGKYSKHVPNSYTRHNGANLQTTILENEFDSQNRLVKKTRKDANGNTLGYTKYYYAN